MGEILVNLMYSVSMFAIGFFTREIIDAIKLQANTCRKISKKNG